MKSELELSYDRVASQYADHFSDELNHKPFDRKMLDWLIEKTGAPGTICDMGCGPGQIARYLFQRGAQVCGVDLSEEMVRVARERNPMISFQQGNMLRLEAITDNSYVGIVAFYSIIHIPKSAVVSALTELKRVLCPGGVLLLTHHIGQELVHLDELLGTPVSLDFIFFETSEMKNYLNAAGFILEEVIERDPYPEVEYQSRRAYLFARKPGENIV